MSGLLVDARAVPCSERRPSAGQSKRRPSQARSSLSSRGPSPIGRLRSRMVRSTCAVVAPRTDLFISSELQIADPLHIDPRAPSGVLCTSSTSPRSLTTSPKDRNKLSINFLSDERPRADSANYSRSHSSVLSTRARGVNRQDVQINNSENVEVATEAPGSPSRYGDDVMGASELPRPAGSQ